MNLLVHCCAGELSCSPSGDRSRARLGEHLTLEDLEISTPDDYMPEDQRQGEEDQTEWGHVSRGRIPTPSTSYPITPSDPEAHGAASSQVSAVHTSSLLWGLVLLHHRGAKSVLLTAAAKGSYVSMGIQLAERRSDQQQCFSTCKL